MTHGDSHGEIDRWDDAKSVQQGETQGLPIVTCGNTGEAGTTPKSKATWTEK